MNQDIKSKFKRLLTEGDGLKKLLLWGGGGFLAFMGMVMMVKVIWGILSMPVWVLLLIGGGGYYAYRKLKGG